MSNKRIFEAYPKITITVVLACILILSDILLANLYKLAIGYPFGQSAQRQSENAEKAYRVSSGIYHHDLKKNVEAESARWGGASYPIFTDSLGFKSRISSETPLKSTKHRLLFIGDSFTEGVGVEYPETFVGIIADKRLRSGVEVLNAGVSSYSPIIYWRKIKYLIEDVGLKFDELIVYIDISDIQDEEKYYRLSENNTVENLPVKKKKNRGRNFFRNNSIILNMPFIGFSFQQDDPDMAKRGRWTIDQAVYEEFGEAGLVKSAYFMDLLYKLVTKYRIKLTIAVYPWPVQIVAADLRSRQVTFWEEWAGKRNVRFLNYFPFFIGVNDSELLRKQTIDRYFIAGDSHWNEAGHRLIADVFLSEMPGSK